MATDVDRLYQGMLNEMPVREAVEVLISQLIDSEETFEYHLEGGSEYSVNLGVLLSKLIAVHAASAKAIAVSRLSFALVKDMSPVSSTEDNFGTTCLDILDEYESLRGVSGIRPQNSEDSH